MHLIIQYYNDSNLERQAELDYCVDQNLNNTYIECVHNLVEPDTVVPDKFKNHPKYKEYKIDTWLQYSQAFEYANKHLSGSMVAVTNLDIYLWEGNDWNILADQLKPLPEYNGPLKGHVLCLGRWDWAGPGKEAVYNKNTQLAQDAWIFNAPIKIHNCDFELGRLGCDNAIAHRIKTSNYIPLNTGSAWKVIHYDECRGKHEIGAIKFHNKADKSNRKRPDTDGHYILPDFREAKNISIDDQMEKMSYDHMKRYMVVCEMLSIGFHLDNESS